MIKNIICNQCGKKFKGDYLQVNKEWGYFSDKDTRVDRFVLCEKCYDKLVEGLKLPPRMDYKKEVI